MSIRRTTPVIGQPVSAAEERAIRVELLEARWVPRAERLEAWSTPIGIGAGAALFLWMLAGVIGAAIQHSHGALS